MLESLQKFIAEVSRSLAEQTFVKLTLGNYKGDEEHLQKLLIRLIRTKKGNRLFFLYRYETRDTAKNYDLADGVDLTAKLLETGFRSGHLFTTTADYQLDIGKKGKSRFNAAKPTFKSALQPTHDRKKTAHIDPAGSYLAALGITNDHGEVSSRQQDKWRQINKFVEILENLFEKSELRGRESLSIVDMGCGKGYLTFAAYDYFRNIRGIDARVTGVEVKPQLVALSNSIAEASGFDGLKFVAGDIAGYDVGDVDILIALHACNTATDAALYKGIQAKASLIVAAPCCHQEIRPQITAPHMLAGVLRHGIMLERVAETLTDGLRSLLLERSGYATKLFEFIATEHTPKNNMLVGTRLEKRKATDDIQQQINEIKETFGIRRQHLETLLERAA